MKIRSNFKKVFVGAALSFVLSSSVSMHAADSSGSSDLSDLSDSSDSSGSSDSLGFSDPVYSDLYCSSDYRSSDYRSSDSCSSDDEQYAPSFESFASVLKRLQKNQKFINSSALSDFQTPKKDDSSAFVEEFPYAPESAIPPFRPSAKKQSCLARFLARLY